MMEPKNEISDTIEVKPMIIVSGYMIFLTNRIERYMPDIRIKIKLKLNISIRG